MSSETVTESEKSCNILFETMKDVYGIETERTKGKYKRILPFHNNDLLYRIENTVYSKKGYTVFSNDPIVIIVEKGQTTKKFELFRREIDRSNPLIQIDSYRVEDIKLPDPVKEDVFKKVNEAMNTDGIYRLYTNDKFVKGTNTESEMMDYIDKLLLEANNKYVIVFVKKNNEGVMLVSRRYKVDDKRKLKFVREYERLIYWDDIEKKGISSGDLQEFAKLTFSAEVKEDVADTKLTKVKHITSEDIKQLKHYAKQKYHY